MKAASVSSDGNWTSFPPHEHQDMLEEAYLYIDMPAPQWGIQMVYTSAETPEFVHIVRDGDAVLMPAGYHPNVAAPGHAINFIWMMAAREVEDRNREVALLPCGKAKAGVPLVEVVDPRHA